MNERLQKFARNSLKEDLFALGLHHTESLRTFRLMYSHEDLTLPINEIVDKMPSAQLDWAMTQVQNSLNKHIKV
jgi:hypothetical protein